MLLTRPCNEGPCPDAVEVNTDKKVNPAILRTAQLSQKPWRYERCIVNELDMDVERLDLKKWPNKPRVPHRVAMNNQTFSFFRISTMLQLKKLMILKI